MLRRGPHRTDPCLPKNLRRGSSPPAPCWGAGDQCGCPDLPATTRRHPCGNYAGRRMPPRPVGLGSRRLPQPAQWCRARGTTVVSTRGLAIVPPRHDVRDRPRIGDSQKASHTGKLPSSIQIFKPDPRLSQSGLHLSTERWHWQPRLHAMVRLSFQASPTESVPMTHIKAQPSVPVT
jgi:hypothetical protein